MRKKRSKSREEKTVEEFFPVDESSVKIAIEKKVKKSDAILEELDKKGKKVTPRKKKETTLKKKKTPLKKKGDSSKKKTVKKKSVKYSFPNLPLKEGGYELIITEKPQAAQKISSALGNAKKLTNNKIPYYEISKNNKKIIVACAVGHLFTLKQKISSEIPIFDVEWVPNYLVRKNDFSKKYYDNLLKLIKGAGSLTVATDYDTEGEVIGWNVVRFLSDQKDAFRMKFSTLTEKELNDSYENKMKKINWGQAIAGETRHYLDWFYGINLSRALMEAIKSQNRFKIMSIGRVQGPALNLIVEKEKSIQDFRSKKYWQVFIKVKDFPFELKCNKDIFEKSKLLKFDKIVGKQANAESVSKQKKLSPLPPFNLTNLQLEAYRLFGITPSRTLQIAQQLYLQGLISYPRTSSQKLPISIGYDKILKKIVKIYGFEKLMKKKSPVEGKSSDPAHPSIYPTGEKLILSGESKKIYELIVKRFLSLFCEDALVENKKINVKMSNKFEYSFSISGLEIIKKSWLEIYPYNLKENEIPDLKGEVEISELRKEEKETQPPKRYTAASIISILEKKHLGTKATRAGIIETLYDRDYIKDKSIKATSLGISLTETLKKYSPIILDDKLTKNFEDEMEVIKNSSKNLEEKKEKILEEAKESIKKIISDFKKNETKIGKNLIDANETLQNQIKEENKLNICPICKKGNLTIKYSKKTKRLFVACDKYPDCKNTYSLPPGGLIKRSDKICEDCGFVMLTSFKKGRIPWTFCFNPNCKKNKKRIEEYRRKNDSPSD